MRSAGFCFYRFPWVVALVNLFNPKQKNNIEEYIFKLEGKKQSAKQGEIAFSFCAFANDSSHPTTRGHSSEFLVGVYRPVLQS